MSRRALLAVATGVALVGGCAMPGEPEAAPTPVGSASATSGRRAATPTAVSPDVTDTPTAPVPELTLEPVVSGLQGPSLVTAPAGDDRLFVLELPGTVRIVRDAELLEEPFLDLTDSTQTGGERGLLGLAFHPRYDQNGRLFVHHSRAPDGATRVVELTVSDDPDVVEGTSERELLVVEQPAGNHNGGSLEFGPDGMLYLGLGDGGGANDAFGNGQDPGTLLGTVVRIDVDADPGERAYAIPPDNPFADGTGGAPEVWAYGLRNPYRFSFDPWTGELWIGDVGQGAWEEIDRAPPPPAEPGRNYGWSVLEGPDCFGGGDCERSGVTPPVHAYPHEDAVCSVIGGYVYRGEAIAGLRGRYVYADLCAAWVRSGRPDGDALVDVRDAVALDGGGYTILSLGRDGAGELYVTTAAGEVLRLVARS